MLKVDATLDHLPVRREHVVTLLESLNQPLVNIPNVGTATTAAYVLGTRGDQGTFAVFVYLRQPDTSAVLIYVSEPRHLSADQFRVEEGEAARFVESMGFLMSNVGFTELSPHQQEEVMARAPLFHPPQSHGVSGLDVPTLDLVDEVTGDDVLPLQGPSFAVQSHYNPRNFTGPPTAFVGQSESYETPPGPQPAFARPPPTVRGRAAPPAQRPAQVRGFAEGAIETGSAPRFDAGRPISERAFEAERSGMVMRSPLDTPRQPSAPEPPRAPEPPPEPADPESLARVGRMLATFALALGLLWPNAGCRSMRGDPDLPLDRGEQAELDIAVEHLGQGNFTEAIRSLTKVLDAAPDNREALHYIGLSYMNLGRLDPAEKYLRHAVDVVPRDNVPTYSVAKNTLGTLLMAQGRCEEARGYFSSALEDIFYPTPQFAEHNLAKAEWCLGKREEAMLRLARLTNRLPQFCLGYLTLADFSVEAKKAESAIDACDAFQSNCVNNDKVKKYVTEASTSMCQLKRGLALAQLGDLDAARQSFLQCSESKSNGPACKHSLELIDPTEHD
ncbi:MAG: tetratricopeptide repeat protein [Deltaproteobacteria bacterium]|nr:tetratricopeptide repeat protein [Deltaproteobacteria bacterium]